MSEERTPRRLAAILAADVVGFSRLMEADETGTLSALKAHRTEAVDHTVALYNGRIVKLMGDGMLVEFASAADAVECAVELQRQMTERNAEIPRDRRIEFRIGINLGDVIPEGDDVYGEGVNVAARLESLADPGSICISGTVHDAIGVKLAPVFEFLGERTVKNIAKPVRIYRFTGGGTRPRGPSASVPAAPRQVGTQFLAVKPFDSFGADHEQDPLADGLTNGIITALVTAPGLAVIHDESPSMAKFKEMTVQELARRFEVRYVLKGRVHKLGDRFRVHTELMEVVTGRCLWAEQFDRNLRDASDLFAIQDEVTEAIVTALHVKILTGEAGRFIRRVFKDPAALDSIYRGEELLWNASTKLELREAQRLFELAMRLEPTVSVGYAQAALAYWTEAISGWSDGPAHSLARAMELAREAIRLDDVTGYPHLVMAHVYLNRRQYDEAMVAADAAILTRPSCPASYALKASALIYLARPEEAIDFAQYALRLTPVHPPMYPAILASAYFGCGLHKEAIDAAIAAIDLDESGVDAHLMLAAANMASGHTEEARRVAAKVLKLKPDFSLAEYALSQPFKQQEHLDRLLDQLRSAGLS